MRKVSKNSGFGSRPFVASLGHPLSTSTSSDTTAKAFRFGLTIKRVFDVIVAAVGLMLLTPILLLTALAIILNSRGPVISRHVRYGYSNQTFRIFAFRCTTPEHIGGFAPPPRGSACVTRVGRMLRSSRIEELPQLVNVLRGEMSIVGPRPYAAPPGMIFEAQLSLLSGHSEIKPGLTGWAQINGCGDANSPGATRRRIEYDLHYVENWSLLFDMKIILLALGSKSTYARIEGTTS